MLKPEILFIMFLITGLMATGLFGLLFWKLNQFRCELAKVSRKVTDNASEEKTERPDFNSNLALAELKARINKARPEVAAPDKYRYIISLVNQGLNHQQIAQVLQMGQGEAEQLVSLAHLRRRSGSMEECIV